MFKYDDKKTFSEKVQSIVRKDGGSYMEAVLEVCQELEIEPEVAAKLLEKPIVEKLEGEARECNLLPRGGSLPM
jgi:hypothetical protein